MLRLTLIYFLVNCCYFDLDCTCVRLIFIWWIMICIYMCLIHMDQYISFLSTWCVSAFLLLIWSIPANYLINRYVPLVFQGRPCTMARFYLHDVFLLFYYLYDPSQQITWSIDMCLSCFKVDCALWLFCRFVGFTWWLFMLCVWRFSVHWDILWRYGDCWIEVV